MFSSNSVDMVKKTYLGLAEGTSHSSLQTISACTGQHFVDPQNMVGMNTDSDVELILGCVFHHVLKLRMEIGH